MADSALVYVYWEPRSILTLRKYVVFIFFSPVQHQGRPSLVKLAPEICHTGKCGVKTKKPLFPMWSHAIHLRHVITIIELVVPFFSIYLSQVKITVWQALPQVSQTSLYASSHFSRLVPRTLKKSGYPKIIALLIIALLISYTGNVVSLLWMCFERETSGFFKWNFAGLKAFT